MFLGWRRLAKRFDLLHQSFGGGLWGYVWAAERVKGQQAVTALPGFIGRFDVLQDWFFQQQPALEDAAVAVGKQIGKQTQRVGLPGRLRGTLAG
ncbi:hypothetical protein D3C80_1308720 [compost metagenome]